MTTTTQHDRVRVGPPEPVGPPPKRSGVGWREWLLAAALLLPNLALLILFTYRPLLDNIRLSFTDWNISAPIANYIGFANYTEWFTREDTRTIVLNTVIFTVATVVLSMRCPLRSFAFSDISRIARQGATCCPPTGRWSG